MIAGATRVDWTFEELLVLHRHYRAVGERQRFVSVANRLPGRTRGAIKQKVHLLRRAGML